VSEQDVYLEGHGHVAVLVLNRPEKRNAVTFDMWSAIPALVDEFENDDTSRVLVVRGAGALAFSAGADISEFQTLRASSSGTQEYNAVAQAAQDRLAAVAKPTVAMIRGACVGGGCGLALSCDLRFCDDTARFAITPAKLGIVYPVNVTKRLVDLVGPAQTKRILFTGDVFGADRAREIGFVQEVHPADGLEDATTAFADTIVARSSYSVRMTKHFVELIGSGLAEENEETLRLRSAAFDTDSYREGVRAFLEKRPPRFT
jgi:enoyl-CoA hydratase/carnithine racemase